MNDIHQDASRTRSGIYSTLLNNVQSPSASVPATSFQFSPAATSSILGGSAPPAHHMHPAHYLSYHYQQQQQQPNPFSPHAHGNPFLMPSSPASAPPSNRSPYFFDFSSSLYQHHQAMMSSLHHQQQQHMSTLPALSGSASSRVSSPPSSQGSSISPTALASPVSGHTTAPCSRSPTVHSPEMLNKYGSAKDLKKNRDFNDERHGFKQHHDPTASTGSPSNVPLHLGCKRKSVSDANSRDSPPQGSLKHRILRPPNIQICDPIDSSKNEPVPLSAPPHMQLKEAMTRQWLEMPVPIETAPLSAPPTHDEGKARRFCYPNFGSSIGFVDSAEPPSSANSLSDGPNKHHAKQADQRKKNSSTGSDSFDDNNSKCSPGSSMDSLDVSSNLQYPVYYKKGSVIQLSDGSFRKVEEMQTQDFLSSASTSPDLRVDTSVIVKLEENAKTCSVYITFAVGKRKANFTVEAPAEHPFYVYHRGWSSCSPERTLSRYGLECHKLKQGDTCISLTKKPKEKLVSSVS